MKTTNIEQAAQDILNYGFIKETRIVAASTEVLINQEKYLRLKHGLTKEDFNEAVIEADKLQHIEDINNARLLEDFKFFKSTL